MRYESSRIRRVEKMYTVIRDEDDKILGRKVDDEGYECKKCGVFYWSPILEIDGKPTGYKKRFKTEEELRAHYKQNHVSNA
jgi:hypothetical protein